MRRRPVLPHARLQALVADARSAPATLVADSVADGAELPAEALLVLAVENERTADYRFFEAGAFTWREPPLTLTVNHDPDQVAGTIDAIGRASSIDGMTVDSYTLGTEGDLIVGHVVFDLGLDSAGTLVNPEAPGRDAARMVAGGFLLGVSVEYGDDVYEMECVTFDDDGFCMEVELRYSAARIGAASVTPFQALESARVVDVSGPEAAEVEAEVAEAVAASLVGRGRLWHPAPSPWRRGPAAPPVVASSGPPADGFPRAWFEVPEADVPTPVTITADGRLYGHAALWGTCHVGREDVCVTPPDSPSGYAYFHTGEVATDGGMVACGVYTMATGHADLQADPRTAAAHYDNTGTQAAYLRASDGQLGIWMCGAVNPDLTLPQRRELQAAVASGDWRRIGGRLEMVAVLAVNHGGFPVPRGLVAGGVQTALVAAGAASTAAGCGCGGACGGCGGSGASPSTEARLARLEAVVAALGYDQAAIEALAASIGPS